MPPVPRRTVRLAFIAIRIAVGFVLAVPFVARSVEPAARTFREQYPASSIDTVDKADAALTATSGARGHVESDYKAASRACMSDLLVNACLDRERDRRRKRLADIDAVELEANRFKRREHADHLDADRARRDAERSAGQPADAVRRAQSRKDFEARQADAARVAAERAQKEASKAASPTRRPPVAASTRPDDPAQRAKNAAEHATKVREAAVHQAEIQRRMATKNADRKRRADDKAAKAAAAAARAPRP